MNAAIRKKFTRYISLNVLGMIAISCYILADTYFISSAVGTLGIVALNLTLPFYNFIYGLGMMLGTGGGIRYSILRANNRNEEAQKVFTNTLILGFLISLLFVLVGLTLSKQITTLLGATGVVEEYASSYFRIFMSFAPLFIISEILLSFVRNSGAPRRAMTAMIIGSLMNAIMDYIFIVILDMGMSGAAFATILSPAISILIYVPFIMSKGNDLKLVRVKLSFTSLLDVSHLGLTVFINEFGFGLVMLIFNSRIMYLEGDMGVAAFGIVTNISIVINAIFTGIATGMQPLLSTAYGKGNKKDIKATLQLGIIVTFLTFVIFYTITTVFSKSIITIFNNDGSVELLNLATLGFYIYFSAYLFNSMNTIIGQYFAAINQAKLGFLISILHAGVIIIPLLFLFSHFWGMTGVWLSFGVAEFFIFGFSLFLLKKNHSLSILK